MKIVARTSFKLATIAARASGEDAAASAIWGDNALMLNATKEVTGGDGAPADQQASPSLLTRGWWSSGDKSAKVLHKQESGITARSSNTNDWS